MDKVRVRHLAALALMVLALGVAGCGSDDSTEGTSATDVTAAPGAITGPSKLPREPGGKPGPSKSGAPSSPVSGLPPKDQIDYAIKAVLASGVPGLACKQTSTENYVKTTFGTRAGCERSTVPGSAATSVVVTGIEIDGKEAKATARPSGGPSDGETIKVGLVREDGIWKVDSLRSDAPVGP